jgi:SNF family Na+-dependent transporter
MSASREHFSSRIGFILAAAGSAVGIGNLVGFPVNAAKKRRRGISNNVRYFCFSYLLTRDGC